MSSTPASSLLCEAKLDDLGSDTAYFLPAPGFGGNPQEAYQNFFQAWQKNYRISNEFKVLVADVQSYLTGVRHWLEELEFGLKTQGDKAEQERAILDAVAPKIIATFNGQHERFEEIIYALPPEARGAHQDFVRQHWHKLFLGSPFAHRTYHKPIGYAGDYEMMNMIHRNQPEGRSLYEKLIHLLLVSQWPAKSVRNRVAHLGENIVNETARVARDGKTARILNVGCGPAQEIQDFLKETQLSNQADFTLIDFNEETLLHAGQKLVEAKRQFFRHTQIRTQQISVYELLKRTQRGGNDAEKFDLIYCAGLFDYLAPDTCRALMELWHDSLSPGGLMLIANMNDTKPFRNFIEFILDWQLIYRDSRGNFIARSRTLPGNDPRDCGADLGEFVPAHPQTGLICNSSPTSPGNFSPPFRSMTGKSPSAKRGWDVFWELCWCRFLAAGFLRLSETGACHFSFCDCFARL